MLTITNQSDYGILFLSSLRFKDDYVSLNELVFATKLPRRFLARIAATLVKHKIVESKEGKTGGYKLTSYANTVTLYDYLRIFEGDMNLAKCCGKEYCCKYKNICKHKDYLQKILTKTLIEELKKIPLKSIIV
jgi:Rrf2 family protein